MPEIIEIPDFPEDLLKIFETRAAEAGLPLEDYLLDELRRIAERITLEELYKRPQNGFV
jgi:hypothetical protein